MPFNGSDKQNIGLYIPTTQIWDPSVLEEIDVNSAQFKEVLIRMYQNLNLMATTVNLKESGYYQTQEFMTGQLFFNPTSIEVENQRPSFRQVIDFGALPDTATKPVPHNLNLGSFITATRVYGAATLPAPIELIPIPYASTIGDNIEIWIDANNVNIATNSNWSAYTKTIVVIEYLKN